MRHLLWVVAIAAVSTTPANARAQRIVFGDPAQNLPAHPARGSDPVKFSFAGEMPRIETGDVQGARPFFVSIEEAPGTYRVAVTLGGTLASDTTVKAELRRLMLLDVGVPANGRRTVDFLVNVRTPEIVGGGSVRLKAPRETTAEAVAWDRRLTLEFNGRDPAVRDITITPVSVPVIYLLGDSTVCDQSGEPYASWGQMLTAMIGPEAVVANHGETGETVAASNDRGRFAKILGEIRPGDLFVVQFGHNDMKDKAKDPQAALKYRDGLVAWARAVQARGARAVIVTPMNRHSFVAGHVVNTLEDYPEMAREAARLSGARLIDLNAQSKTLYEAFGEQPSLALFKHDADGSNADTTHHSPFGAWELARIVASDLAGAGLPVSAAVKPAFRSFDPAHPDALADFHVPPSPNRLTMRPLGDDAYKGPL
ncbi:GDSL-type esterase/lipase family protein [Sphingomonas sp. BAUL-RG-20F-R05-02]|uniref:GDSL-type esterase/lipase family protein n=1 Tax=Sphingomonas sp. BAUL-RG-20F-R05-02 TaxID=2914830 RepID=UPI001F5AEDAB|nr:GDSL-type esterase/lipase family protein [Sphingomonas sp. BAUL-RG-20F-R05-02]